MKLKLYSRKKTKESSVDLTHPDKSNIGKPKGRFRSFIYKLKHIYPIRLIAKRKLLGRAFRLIKLLLKVGLIILILVSIVSVATYLRYKQTCGYQNLVQTGQVTVVDQTKNICPNIFSVDGIQQAVENLVSFDTKTWFQSTQIEFDSSSKIVPSDACTDQDSLLCLLTKINGDLKQDNNYTNILLVGTDRRGTGILGNTDTLMLVSYYHPTGQIMLLSFPRDVVVAHTTPQGWNVKNRINAIFASYGYYNTDTGVEALNSAISQVTGQPIHYYFYFNFDVFHKILSIVGDIEVYLDKPFRDAYPCNEIPDGYPKENDGTGFCVFNLPAGVNKLDVFFADMFARSRKYSSDYSRAGRQQNVFEGILSNLLRTPRSLQSRLSLFTTLYSETANDIKTNITPEDAVGVFKIINNIKSSTAKVIITPQLDNGNIIREDGWNETFNSHSVFLDYSYTTFQNFLATIRNNVSFFIDSPKIKVITPASLPEGSQIKKYIDSNPPFSNISVSSEETKIKGIRIYDLSGTKKGAVSEIKNHIPELITYSHIVDGVTQSDWGEDILIIYNP